MKKRLFFILALPLVASSANAATNTWKTTTGSTSWATASNWSSGHAPISTDDIAIPGGGTQPIFSGSDNTISSLTLGSGATLTLSSGAGALTLSGGGAYGGINNGGTIAIGSNNVTVSSGSGAVTNSGVITLSGGILNDPKAGIVNSGAGASIIGSGRLIGEVINEDGALIAVSGGNMTINDGLSNSASITIASGDVLTATGGITNSGAGTISGPGSLSSNTPVTSSNTWALTIVFVAQACNTTASVRVCTTAPAQSILDPDGSSYPTAAACQAGCELAITRRRYCSRYH